MERPLRSPEGGSPGEDEALLEDLVATDVGGWLSLDEAAVAVVERAGRARHLALLSNAPHPLADRLDAQPWATLFPTRFYSCRLGVVKPDPAIFEAVLAALGAEAYQALLIDDRPANTAAAREAGLAAITFTSAADLDARLAALPAGPAGS